MSGHLRLDSLRVYAFVHTIDSCIKRQVPNVSVVFSFVIVWLRVLNTGSPSVLNTWKNMKEEVTRERTVHTHEDSWLVYVAGSIAGMATGRSRSPHPGQGHRSEHREEPTRGPRREGGTLGATGPVAHTRIHQSQGSKGLTGRCLHNS